MMKAFTKYKYGGPEILKLEELEKPVPTEHEILVKVKANSANPADWHILRGAPFLARLTSGLFKPKDSILGADFSGIVEAVGSEVDGFKVGDHVMGESLKGGAFAEYICLSGKACAIISKNASFTEMACVPVAGLTALQALITHGKLTSGESILINGSSGGVGHFAVQIAKAYGAAVTGVCSSKSVEFVKSLGADKVIAYDQQNIQEYEEKHDVVLDAHGNLRHSDFKRLGRRGIVVGFTTMGHMISVLLKNVFSKFKLAQFTAEANTTDLETLASLIENQKIKACIEKTYDYTQIPEAIGYIEAMHTKGKVAMVWQE